MKPCNYLFLVVMCTAISCSTSNAPTVIGKPQVNIGNGTVDVNQRTTAISQIDMNNAQSTSITWKELLQKASGVVVQGDGSDLSIRIRGSKTLNGSQEPLFVVDNLPMGQGFDNIDFIDPVTVRSISVLKDAASTSFYGVRGANGVILVTLK